jgi:hypothetical protein
MFPLNGYREIFFLMLKWPGHEHRQSPLSNVEFKKNADKTPFHKSLHWVHGLFILLPDENLRREPSADQLQDWRFLWFVCSYVLLEPRRYSRVH